MTNKFEGFDKQDPNFPLLEEFVRREEIILFETEKIAFLRTRESTNTNSILVGIRDSFGLTSYLKENGYQVK